MGDSFKESMAKTMSDFNSEILPLLQKTYPDAKFVEIEGRADDEIAKDFDIYAGIDVYRVRTKQGEMVGIASRIQRGKAWKTFTVRYKRDSGTKTEYEKRKQAIKNGSLYPYFTMQAYISDKETVVGLCKTTDLIKFIDTCKPKLQHTGATQHGQASFYVCGWDEMRKSGYIVRELRA